MRRALGGISCKEKPMTANGGGWTRRRFLKNSSYSLGGVLLGQSLVSCRKPRRQPNLVFVFAVQWRAQDTGFAGNKIVRTPNLDRFAGQSVQLTNAVSGCPVCSPYRASLITGQYWLTHGIFHNDKPLGDSAVSIAQAYKSAGYDTAYIGKWHINGHIGAVAGKPGCLYPTPAPAGIRLLEGAGMRARLPQLLVLWRHTGKGVLGRL